MAIRRLVASAVLVAALAAATAACSGDGDVVLPSDTRPKPSATTAQALTCAQVLATTTTSATEHQIVLCAERK